MMRVLQILDTMSWGGAQKMQVFLAESLLPLGVQLSLASMQKKCNSTIPRDLASLGVDVQMFDFPGIASPKQFAGLVKFIRGSKFDIIHAHLTNANIIGTLAGRFCGIPAIASLRNSGLDKRYHSKPKVLLENMVVSRGATRIMANGWAVGEFAKKRFGQREIDVIPNAIDPFPPLSKAERIAVRAEIVKDFGRPIILSVGRLVDNKSFPDLINAFAQLHKTNPEYALAIAGNGDQREKLSALIHELGLDGHAFLLGVRNDVSRLMSAADLYVNSSTVEGLPVTVLEAMAAGLPVIATRVGDTPHVLTGGAGILVDPGRPEQIAHALLDLAANPEKQRALGAASLDRIRNGFNRRAWTIKLLTMYEKITPSASQILRLAEAK